MPIAKSGSALLTSQATTTTSSAASVAGDYAAQVGVTITQVGTASTPASFNLNFSYDGGTTYFPGPTYSAGTAASTYNWSAIEVPVAATNLTITYTQQSGGTSSACTAVLGQVTSV